MRWAAHAEATRDMNKRMNAEAARLTEIFSKEGRHTAVLKGAANARLYPDPLSRQCGDIDFWVDGGFKSVEDLLLKLKFIPEHEETSCRHHIHMPKNKDGVTVEIHYRPASGNPYKNGELQKYLNKEILNSELVPEGFYSPTIKFALVMQLSHLQQGSPFCGFSQFIALAKILASVVLPTPRGPTKRYAWAVLFWMMAFFSVRTTCCCPTTSLKFCGRHFLAMT